MSDDDDLPSDPPPAARSSRRRAGNRPEFWPYLVAIVALILAVVASGIYAAGGLKDPLPTLLLIGGAVAAVVIAIVAMLIVVYEVRSSARDPYDPNVKGILDFLVLGGLPFLVLVGGVVTYYLVNKGIQDGSAPGTSSQLPDQLSITFFLAFSVIALLLALSMTAIFFSWVKLADKRQPLGLPEGSVRAVIALSLIIIFAITAVFLYSHVSTSNSLTLSGLTQAQVDQIPVEQRLSTTQDVTPTPAPGTTPGPDDARFTVTRIDPASQAGNTLAQQIITTVSTLVVAVSAFYFGSSSVKSATDALAAATAANGLRILAPRPPVTLRRSGEKWSLLDIEVEPTPRNVAVTGEVLGGDDQGTLAQTTPTSFTYLPGKPTDRVLLRFALVGDASTNTTLVVFRPPADPTTTSSARQGPAPSDGGSKTTDTTDGQAGSQTTDTADGQAGSQTTDTADGQAGSKTTDTADGQAGSKKTETVDGKASDAGPHTVDSAEDDLPEWATEDSHDVPPDDADDSDDDDADDPEDDGQASDAAAATAAPQLGADAKASEKPRRRRRTGGQATVVAIDSSPAVIVEVTKPEEVNLAAPPSATSSPPPAPAPSTGAQEQTATTQKQGATMPAQSQTATAPASNNAPASSSDETSNPTSDEDAAPATDEEEQLRRILREKGGRRRSSRGFFSSE